MSSSATTARARSRRGRRGARAGLAHQRRLRTTSSSVFNDPLVRDPFLRVFVWTFVFAPLCRAPHVRRSASSSRSRSTSRAPLPAHPPVAPLIPVRDPGVPLAARLARAPERRLRRRQQASCTSTSRGSSTRSGRRSRCLLVNFWLTFPYFFLVSIGALQSIPGEMTEAARVDGARALQVFRRDHAAAAAGRGRAAPDRLVRLQLQQLQQHLPAHRRAARRRGPVGRRRDRHPDQLHVQARLRGRQGRRLRARERRLDPDLLHRRRRSRRSRSGDEGPGERRMTHRRPDRARARRGGGRCRAPRTKPAPRRPELGDMWWRHLVGIVALVFALFPVAYIVSAAFNADGDAERRVADPARRHARQLPHDPLRHGRRRRRRQRHPVHPLVREHDDHRDGDRGPHRPRSARSPPTRSAASASRGRRFGMLSLLLIQMFPQFLAVVAIYLIVLNTGDVFPLIGLNTLTGADPRLPRRRARRQHVAAEGLLRHDPHRARRVGPRRRRDPGAGLLGRHPAARRARARRGRAALVRRHAERVRDRERRCSRRATSSRSRSGCARSSTSSTRSSGAPFSAGVLLAAIPVVLLFAFLQRFIVSGLTQGAVKG